LVYYELRVHIELSIAEDSETTSPNVNENIFARKNLRLSRLASEILNQELTTSFALQASNSDHWA